MARRDAALDSWWGGQRGMRKETPTLALARPLSLNRIQPRRQSQLFEASRVVRGDLAGMSPWQTLKREPCTALSVEMVSCAYMLVDRYRVCITSDTCSPQYGSGVIARCQGV